MSSWGVRSEECVIDDSSDHPPPPTPLSSDQAPPPTHYNYSLLPLNLEEIMTGQEAGPTTSEIEIWPSLIKGQQVHLNYELYRTIEPSHEA